MVREIEETFPPVEGVVVGPGNSRLVQLVAASDEAVCAGWVVRGVSDDPLHGYRAREALSGDYEAFLQSTSSVRRQHSCSAQVNGVGPSRRLVHPSKSDWTISVHREPPPSDACVGWDVIGQNATLESGKRVMSIGDPLDLHRAGAGLGGVLGCGRRSLSGWGTTGRSIEGYFSGLAGGEFGSDGIGSGTFPDKKSCIRS